MAPVTLLRHRLGDRDLTFACTFGHGGKCVDDLSGIGWRGCCCSCKMASESSNIEMAVANAFSLQDRSLRLSQILHDAERRSHT